MDEKEYIEREALLDKIGSIPAWTGYEPYPFEVHQGLYIAEQVFKNLIKNQPAADVQEVRRGKWIANGFDEVYNYDEVYCSNCECQLEPTLEGDRVRLHRTEYCPHCGARIKMTPQEAIDRLHKIPVRPKPDNALDMLAIITACKALEKQIPKKPVKSDTQAIRYVVTYDCPICGKQFTGTGIADYCYHCGQALDWGETND